MSHVTLSLATIALLLISRCLPAQEADPPEVKTVSYAHIQIKGNYPEGEQGFGLFGDITENLDRALKRLETAANDRSITGVMLEIRNPSIGWGKIHELRLAIERVRNKGKKVYAVMETADTNGYLLASKCDAVVLPESGILTLLGVRAEVMFYKNLFDMLDIQADMLRVGDYKAAAEPYTRESMSEATRENMTAIVDDYYQQLVAMIAEDRGLSKEDVQAAIDVGLITPKDAKQRGLIDHIAYEGQVEELLKNGEENVKIALNKKYAKKEIDTDFSGLSGMIKLMNLLTGTGSKRRSTGTPKVAVIYATGIITTGRSSSDPFTGTSTMGSDTIVKAIREAKGDASVKAIVLRVDSPGGSALASDLIWHELESVDKPVVVSMGDVAGSGGYYISMGADKIYAEPGTLTGSIGVLGGKISFRGLLKKVGLTIDIIKRGENATVMSPFHAMTENERQVMQKMLDSVYEQFTEKAAAGRNMDVEELRKLAGGRVYTGLQAKEVGLVDEIGTLDDAVDHAVRLAGLNPDRDKPERLILPEPTSPFEALFGPLETTTPPGPAQFNPAMQTAVAISPELAGHIQAAMSIARMLQSERRLVIMPYRLQIR